MAQSGLSPVRLRPCRAHKQKSLRALLFKVSQAFSLL
jgi:hypothetical protein